MNVFPFSSMDRIYSKLCITQACKEICKVIEKEVKNKCRHIQKRCTRQPAQTAEKNVMFLSSQTVAGQFTVESATANEDHHEDIKLLS